MKKIISLCLTLVLLLAVLVGCVQTPDTPDNPTKPTINKTDIKIVDLSLIHISEPTRR